jgi:hypothetical protein
MPLLAASFQKDFAIFEWNQTPIQSLAISLKTPPADIVQFSQKEEEKGLLLKKIRLIDWNKLGLYYCIT